MKFFHSSFLLFTILIAIPNTILSQERNYNKVSNSLQIIERLNLRAKEITTFQSSFKQQKYMSYLDATIESNGIFFFKTPQQIRWEYTNPYQHLIIINNGELIIKSQNQKQGSIPKEGKLFDQLNSIVQLVFKGKLGHDNNFASTFLENNMSYKLVLIPKSSEMKAVFREMNLWFDKTSLNISKIQIIEASGDYTMLTFDKHLYNKNIPDLEFIIN